MSSLATRIAARLDNEFDGDSNPHRDYIIEDLIEIARLRKLSAAKLPRSVFQSAVLQYEGIDEEDEAHPDDESNAPSEQELLDEAMGPEPTFSGSAEAWQELADAATEEGAPARVITNEDDDSNVSALRRLSDTLTPADDSPKATTHTKAVRDAAKASAPRKGAHADCDHESTKAARAKCRRERAKAASDHKDA